MSELIARLDPIDSGIWQMFEAGRYFGADPQHFGAATLNRWCDLRKRGHPDETMADLLAVGAVSEDELRACFQEAS